MKFSVKDKAQVVLRNAITNTSEVANDPHTSSTPFLLLKLGRGNEGTRQHRSRIIIVGPKILLQDFGKHRRVRQKWFSMKFISL